MLLVRSAHFWLIYLIVSFSIIILYLMGPITDRCWVCPWGNTVPLTMPTSFWVGGRSSCVPPWYVPSKHVIMWSRYIDDILFVWSGTRDYCLKLVTALNDNPFNIHFTMTISDSSMDFLDLTLQMENNRINTTLHQLRLQIVFLNFSAFHLKRGWPVQTKLY